MRSLSSLALAVALGVALAVPASAQQLTESGTYSVKVGVVPAALPDQSILAGLPELGPDLYEGTLTLWRNEDGSGMAMFKGEREDGAQLIARAKFGPGWAGVGLGNLVVGSVNASDVIKSIHVAALEHAIVNGVGTVDGEDKRVIARFGAGGSLELFKAVPAPRNGR